MLMLLLLVHLVLVPERGQDGHLPVDALHEGGVMLCEEGLWRRWGRGHRRRQQQPADVAAAHRAALVAHILVAVVVALGPRSEVRGGGLLRFALG